MFVLKIYLCTFLSLERLLARSRGENVDYFKKLMNINFSSSLARLFSQKPIVILLIKIKQGHALAFSSWATIEFSSLSFFYYLFIFKFEKEMQLSMMFSFCIQLKRGRINCFLIAHEMIDVYSCVFICQDCAEGF
jgi:hypothetical protein